MTRWPIPFGDAVVTIGLKLIRQFAVSMRRALSVATITGHRFDASALKISPPKRLYTEWELINDNFCDFIGAAVAVAVSVVRCVDVDVIAFGAAAAIATMLPSPLFTLRLVCVDMLLCMALVLFGCNNDAW